MIRSGRADVVVAGGTEAAIHPLPHRRRSRAMQALSTRNDEPERASRPYDKGRDGFVLGEGAGVLVLESAEHAKARGAKIYAEIAGAGITSDAHHIAAARPGRVGAPARAMRMALEAAGVDARRRRAHQRARDLDAGRRRRRGRRPSARRSATRLDGVRVRRPSR